MEIKKNFNQIYGLINNAGVAVFSPLEERTFDELLYVTKVNSFAPIFLVQGFINVINKELSPSIINLGSIYGINAPDQRLYSDTPRNSSEIYGMTKAIINLTKYLAVYLSNIILDVIVYHQEGFISNKVMVLLKIILKKYQWDVWLMLMKLLVQ